MSPRLLAATLLLLVVAAVPAEAAPGPLPPANAVFPTCSPQQQTYCVGAIEADVGNTGTFSAAPANVTLRTFLFSAFADRDTLELSAGRAIADGPTFAELLPAGTPVRFTVNTGAWTPEPMLSGRARISSWSRSFDAATGWTISVEAATTATTTALNCSASEGCDAPTDVTDDASTLALSVSGPSRPQLDALPPDLRALNYAIWESLTGSYFGTSASAWGFPPTLNAETGAVSVDVAAPHLTAAGDVNVGFVTTFMPAAAIRSFWGADPATIAPGAFVATRRDGTRVVPTAASVARVDGGLRITFEGITYSTPRLTLRPKRLLRAPRTLRAKAGPRNSRRVALTAAKVKDARRYQAACSRGRRTVFARSTRRTLVVRGLAKATWTCRVRAVYQVGGRWSPTQRVRVR